MKIPQTPAHISSLQRYIAGRSIEEVRKELGLERIIKLASNENPLGPSPKALEAIQRSLPDISLYPDGGLLIRERLAEYHGIPIDNIVAGSGSEAVMSAFMRAHLMPGDEAITAEGTFIGFYVLSHAQNLALKTVPLKNYTFDLEAILSAITPRTRLVYIPNPNNPTGTAVSDDEFNNFLRNLPDEVLVIMDEAYFEFAREWKEYPNSLDNRHDQVMTLRSFSKAYGLAGIRIGYGIGHPKLVENTIKVKLPFEPSVLAQAAGIGALDDHQFLSRTLEMNRQGKARLCTALDALGQSYAPSLANFIMVIMENGDRAIWLSNQLLLKGIIARPMIPFRLPHTVRITIGTEEQTTILIEALQEILTDKSISKNEAR